MLLPNGLELLSKEVHAAPVVSVWVYYRVGSRDEVQGIRGISHQVEHMMFKGTDQLGPGDIDRIFSRRGGENNAQTTQDYTAYNETLPSSALGVALQVEANRMENSAMDPAQLQHEKTVVLSELEGDENSPQYKLDLAVTEGSYQAHPYHNPVGGFLADVRRFTRSQVAGYYLEHYAPNNAVLVVVGDFNTLDLERSVARDFGSVPRRSIESHPVTPETPQNGERRVILRGIGNTGYVEIAYHVPQTGERDHYVMDVLSTLMAGGPSSRLYRDLVIKGLATEVGAGDEDHRDPYLMQITATVAAGHTHQEVESAIETEIDRLSHEVPSHPEVQKARNQIRAEWVYQNDGVEGQAATIGLYSTIGLEGYQETYLQRIESITPFEVQRVAQQYFTTDNRTVGWFLARPPRPGEVVTSGHAGAIHYRPVALERHWSPETDRRVARRGVPSLLISQLRSPLVSLVERRRRRRAPTRPAAVSSLRALLSAPLPAPANRPHPEAIRRVLPNGMVVIVYPNPANPDVAISGNIRAGAMADPAGKPGVGSFTAAMLSHGTASRNEEQIASQLDFVGSTVAAQAAESGTSFSGQSLAENLPLTLDVMADELLHPSFPPEVTERTRNEIETAIQSGEEDPGTVATEGLFAALYPPDYPLHWPNIGTAESVRSISRQDLVDFHNRYYRPDLATIVVVGDVDPETAFSLVERSFGGWTAQGPPPTTIPESLSAQLPARRDVHTIPDRSEELVAMGFRGITRKDPRFYAARLVNLILGSGDFNSRLMHDVRDVKGLVYTIDSRWDAGLVAGPWMAEMETNPNDTQQAMTAAIADVRSMQQQGPTPAEMELFKDWVQGSQALELETDAGIAGVLGQSEFYGLGLDYLWRYPALIQAVTFDQAREAARTLLFPDNMIVSAAGPYREAAVPAAPAR